MRYALLLALVGCGSKPADDADADGGPDSRGTVTVHLVDKLGAPIPDMRVLFVDTDATLTDVMTDASGTAQATVNENATVTAMRVSDSGCAYSLTTLTALVPGDDMTLISAPSTSSNADDAFTQRVIPIDATAAGDFTVSYPSLGGAGNYRVYTPCGPTDVGTLTSPTLPFSQGCVASPMQIVVLATTNTGTPLKYIEATNVAFTAGGNVTINDTWHDLVPVTATYSNTTSLVTRVEVERFGAYVRGLPMTAGTGTAAGNTAMVAMTTATPSEATFKTRLLCPAGSSADCTSSMTGVGQQTCTHTVNGTQTAYAFDVQSNALPWVFGDYNPTTRTLEVSTTSTAVVDIYEANLRYYRKGAPQECNLQWIYTWRVFGPIPEAITFPTLPGTLPGDPNVRPTDTQSAYQLYIGESDAIDGYRDAIKNVYEALAVCESSPTLLSKLFKRGTLNRISQWN